MADLIDRQKTLEKIYQLQPYPIIDRDAYEFYRDVRESIKLMPSAEPKWIPVTERLPEKGGWYLVTWEDQFKTVRRVAVSEFIEPKGLTDIGHFEGFVLSEVIAWMPLPEPYKPEPYKEVEE